MLKCGQYSWQLLRNSQQSSSSVVSYLPIYSKLPVQLTPVLKTLLQFPDNPAFLSWIYAEINLKKNNHIIWHSFGKRYQNMYQRKIKAPMWKLISHSPNISGQSSIKHPPDPPLYYVIHALSPVMSLDLACQKLSTETAPALQDRICEDLALSSSPFLGYGLFLKFNPVVLSYSLPESSCCS